jgi:hypothetical protein
MHEFDASDRDRRSAKPLEPEHRAQTELDVSVILLNQIIEILGRPQFRPCAAPMFGEELPGRAVRGLVAVERDGARQSALALERPLEKSLRGSDRKKSRPSPKTTSPRRPLTGTNWPDT